MTKNSETHNIYPFQKKKKSFYKLDLDFLDCLSKENPTFKQN